MGNSLLGSKPYRYVNSYSDVYLALSQAQKVNESWEHRIDELADA